MTAKESLFKENAKPKEIGKVLWGLNVQMANVRMCG